MMYVLNEERFFSFLLFLFFEKKSSELNYGEKEKDLRRGKRQRTGISENE